MLGAYLTIDVPELCLVVLIGPAGAGKTTFAHARFRPTEVVSSDACRALVADRESDLSATPDAFEVLRLVASLRLRRRRLTVVDAVSARPADRRSLLALALARDSAAVAVVLDLPEEVCVARDHARPGRTVGPRAIAAQRAAIQRSLPGLRDEGFAAVHVLGSTAEVDAAVVRRVPLPVDRRRERGPFDVIGDVHGRLAALVALLARLGYRVELDAAGAPVSARHPEGRRAVFAGDLVGPGPDDAGAARLAMGMVHAGAALAVRGDRDDELGSVLAPEAAGFLAGLPSHLVLAGGRLVAVHAGVTSDMQGRDSPRVTRFCLRAEPGWASSYRGGALVVHGHDPVARAGWEGRTIGLRTDDALTALRHPELELVSVAG
jgi:protein phosphatase